MCICGGLHVEQSIPCIYHRQGPTYADRVLIDYPVQSPRIGKSQGKPQGRLLKENREVVPDIDVLKLVEQDVSNEQGESNVIKKTEESDIKDSNIEDLHTEEYKKDHYDEFQSVEKTDMDEEIKQQKDELVAKVERLAKEDDPIKGQKIGVLNLVEQEVFNKEEKDNANEETEETDVKDLNVKESHKEDVKEVEVVQLVEKTEIDDDMKKQLIDELVTEFERKAKENNPIDENVKEGTKIQNGSEEKEKFDSSRSCSLASFSLDAEEEDPAVEKEADVQALEVEEESSETNRPTCIEKNN